jgi:hypothetical protein
MNISSEGTNNTVTSNQIGMNTGTINIVSSNPDDSLSGEFPIPKIYGLSCDDAREKLIASGWIPARNHHNYGSQFSYGNGKIFWERGYWEVDACSGTGEGLCLFKFFDPSRRILTVTTTGEEAVDGAYHAKVVRFSLADN